jgi:riboflavin biosynthesis pyrimidine reductase
MVFVAPKLLGGTGRGLLEGPGVGAMDEAFKLSGLKARQVGMDILIEGEVHNVHRPD